MRILILYILLGFYCSILFGQSNITIADIKQKYESFEYSDVIQYTNIYLYNNLGISKSDSIEVLTMKGISQYSMGEEEDARETFSQILNLDYDHQLNPVAISPKIIDLYESVKSDQKMDLPQQNESKIETTILPINYNSVRTNVYKNSFTRSILAPGWGHIYLGVKTKGWVLTGLSTAALGSMIYFIAETNSKEQDYLNETDPNLIEEKYNDYNSTYKLRNTFIIGYAVLWIYSQFDLLFNSEELFEEKIKMSLSIDNNVSLPQQYKLQFQIALD